VTGAAHGEITLGGPGIPVLAALLAIALAGALFILIDAARRRDAFARAAYLVAWVAPQVVYVVALVLAFVMRDRSEFAAAAGIVWLIAAPAQIAYLLRVVYPSRKRTAAANEPDDPS
jgi:cytochrome bd-type quinol oxidase subunit 2